MLDIALNFLADELASHLLKRGATGAVQDLVSVSMLVDEKGHWIGAKDTIKITLINLEEERVLREQAYERVNLNGNQITLPPALKLNLNLLFSVFPSNAAYAIALSRLSHVLAFFQANQSFSADTHPGLDPRISRLNLELLSLTSEQLNQTWAYLGAKYLPSAIYRVRLLLVRDTEPLGVAKPITTIDAEAAQQ